MKNEFYNRRLLLKTYILNIEYICVKFCNRDKQKYFSYF